MSKQLNVVEKWHQVEVDDIMTGNETNSGSVGGETGQNKHKQNVRGKKDRYHRLPPSPVHQDYMATSSTQASSLSIASS